MVPGNGSQLCAYAPTSPGDAKTISISIRRGSDGRSSSIVLPREHHLARHLEQLMSSDTPSPKPQTQPQQPTGYNVVSALSSVVKYIHATSRHEAPDASIAALFSSLRPPSDRVDASVNCIGASKTEQSLPNTPEQPATRSRRRRSSNGRTRITKRCKVLGCGNISVSRGLCRGHGGGRRCHYIGCSKSAQSRSVFCWAHGGGHRCEVVNCMRSLKSKHFCADHVSLENATTHQTSLKGIDLILNDVDEIAVPTEIPRNTSLPSLQDALRNSQQMSMTL